MRRTRSLEDGEQEEDKELKMQERKQRTKRIMRRTRRTKTRSEKQASTEKVEEEKWTSNTEVRSLLKSPYFFLKNQHVQTPQV